MRGLELILEGRLAPPFVFNKVFVECSFQPFVTGEPEQSQQPEMMKSHNKNRQQVNKAKCQSDAVESPFHFTLNLLGKIPRC